MNPYRLAPAGFLFHLNSRPVHHQIMRPRLSLTLPVVLFKSVYLISDAMKIKIAWLEDAKEMETSSKTVLEILKELKINPEIVLVSVNNEIVPDDSQIKENDYVEILKVVSGG